MQYTVTCAVKYHRIYLYGNCEQELYTLHMNLTNVCIWAYVCIMALCCGMHGCSKRDSSAVSAKEPQKSANE